MTFADFDLDEIRKRIFEAYQNEKPIFEDFRKYAKDISNLVKPIRPYSVNAVSFVSSDGGDNRLYFNPAVIELVRVVDSRGNQCATDAIASNTKTSDLNERINADSPLIVKPLKKMCEDLNINRVEELSYLLSGLEEG